MPAFVHSSLLTQLTMVYFWFMQQNNADSGSWERGKGEGAAKSKWR